ncbi:MAG: FAD:protein FMN transferase [Phycisphaerales bacterium]|nr:MAG: FAD:protein FMN transferase [Phycisphaerales bacterium]
MMDPAPETPFVEADWASLAGVHRFSHEAMATTYEIFIWQDDVSYARQAAQAAFEELDRLEAELSRFIENSDISRINNLPAGQPLQIGLAAFDCLKLSVNLCAETEGAFDITVGSLLECWLNEDKSARVPSEEELSIARKHTGMHLLRLDEVSLTVGLLESPVRIDLGGVGKGYALDQMAELLREWSVNAALLHGGFSSVLALDAPPGTEGWPLTLSRPGAGGQTLARLNLKYRAVSGSGVQKGRHIIDPRTGRPVEAICAAWAVAGDAATADGLSTAFMVMSPDEVEQYCSRHPETLAMVVPQDQGKGEQTGGILRIGHWKEQN